MHAHAATHRRTINRRALLALLALLLAVSILAAPGAPDPLLALAAVLHAALTAGSLALAWTLGAVGLGQAFAPALRPIRDTPARLALQAALGIALALTLAHAMGVLALTHPWIAWAPTLLGLALLVRQARASGAATRPRPRPRNPLALLAIPALALLLVAASNPPGALWASEANAYDVLSYHLMLPREWLAAGRIEPLTHNVYSFLPSYVEAAYTQLGAMSSALPATHPAPLGLGAGTPVLAASFLHALLAIVAALNVAALVRRLTTPPAADAPAAPASATLAAIIFLAVPWTIVVASLAYNEMALALLLAAALVAANESDLQPTARAALAALLVGVAASCKPTALFIAAPPVALALALSIPPRRWPAAALATIPAGLAPLAPWLIRNALAADTNPVFPSAAKLLSAAHWSADQLQRWNDAHHISLALPARLARLLDPAHGLTHHQFSLLFLFAALAIPITLAVRTTRRPALLLTGALALQTIAWLAVGHLQARFLIPLTVPAAALIALTAPALAVARLAHASLALPLLAVAALTLASITNFLRQNDGAPNVLLIPGVPFLSAADTSTPPPPLADPATQAFYASRPPSFVVNKLPLLLDTRNATVLLVGDATPLYLGAHDVTVLYATTWDTNPLAHALERTGDDPAAALHLLADEHDVTHILINLAELNRLQTSGYLDPRLAPANVAAIARDHTTALFAWPDAGRLLVALP